MQIKICKGCKLSFNPHITDSQWDEIYDKEAINPDMTVYELHDAYMKNQILGSNNIPYQKLCDLCLSHGATLSSAIFGGEFVHWKEAPTIAVAVAVKGKKGKIKMETKPNPNFYQPLKRLQLSQ